MPTLDAIGIVVSNMAKTLAFYRLLGLDIPAAEDSQEHVETEIIKGVHIVFDTIDDVNRFTEHEKHIAERSVGFAFRCKDADDVDRIYTAVSAAGYKAKRPPFDSLWGQRYATLLDPNENPVELYAPTTATPS